MEIGNVKVLDSGTTFLDDLNQSETAKYAAYFNSKAANIYATCFNSTAANHKLAISQEQVTFVEHSVARFSSVGGCSNNCFQKSMVKNYSNFTSSGLLQRLMMYQNGEWNDVSEELVQLVREGFKEKKAITEVVYQGNTVIFDFLLMVKVDLLSGLEQSIAWIDESGSCFFPELHIDFEFCTCGGKQQPLNVDPNGTGEIEVKLEIAINGRADLTFGEFGEAPSAGAKQVEVNPDVLCNLYDQSNAENDGTNAVSQYDQSNSENDGTNGASLLHAIPTAQALDCGLTKLFISREDYQVVQKIFMSGLGRFINTDSVVGIYRAPLENILVLNRKKLFHEQGEFIKSRRGNANVRYGWIAASSEDVKRIMLYGIGHSRRLNFKPMYGIGVHLASAYCSHISARHSDVDENGIHHLVLCRVILGNMEVVLPESEQFQPTSENFDSGVDDLMKPKHFTMWSMNMNSHIFPEYVVSFRMPQGIRELLEDNSCTSGESSITHADSRCWQVDSPSDSVGSCKQSPPMAKQPIEKGRSPSGLLRFRQKMPKSPWMPFPMLFDAISNKIPHEHMEMVDCYYNQYLRKKLTRIDFIKKLRTIIGDKLLKSTIMSIQHKSPCIRRHEPVNGIASQASN
ncbi:inactive poly [ADP-ribose] polymerase RCD1-like [Aristolochia californica]|uniref:inactive poly [ADP-ribose] polymerase RCD1-like n=1 Tax=Aristolochia californica TaxID=171875 RepID=UPI0035D5981E